MTDYATAEEVRDQINKTSTGDDAIIEAIISAVSQAIDDYCNRPDGFVALTTATAREYPGSGEAHLWIDECTEVTLVETRSSANDDYTEWDDDDDWITFTGDPRRPTFNRTPYAGLLVRSGGDYATFAKSDHYPMARVTAKWGYATTVPNVVKQACIVETARIYKRGQAAFSDTTASGELGTLLYQKELDPAVQWMLRLGRLIRPKV